MIRAMLLSDLHFGCEDPAALRAAADYCHGFAPDIVLVAGDVSSMGRRREMQAAALWLRALGRPIAATPGNHDTPYWNIFARLAAPFARFSKALVFAPASHQAAAIEPLLTARGVQWRPDWSLGAVSAAETERIATRFERADPRLLRIVLAHHPLLAPEGLDTPRTQTRGGAAAATRLAHAGADLVLTGHLHVPFVLPVPGYPHCHLVGGGTLSRRVRGAPPSFLTLEGEPGAVHVTIHACVGPRSRVADRTAIPLPPERLAPIGA